MWEEAQQYCTTLFVLVKHTHTCCSLSRQVLKNALERAESKGWIQRVTGKGFTGTFRLIHPYRPPPKELWGDW